MALTIALPLSGLEPEHFYALGARVLYDRGVKSLAGIPPISPSSCSESSGICSLATCSDTPTPTTTPEESRPGSPEDAKIYCTLMSLLDLSQDAEVVEASMRNIIYQSRDLLDLAENIRGSEWSVLHPTLPRDNPAAFMANRSLYYRLGEHGLVEDYPTKCCSDCSFCEPSPILSF